MEKGLNERLLLQKIASGDREAFRILFDQYHNRVYSYAFRILKLEDAAEDVVQDIFLKLWLSRHELIEIESIEAYFKVITRNHTLKILRRKALEPRALEMIGHVGNELHNETENLIDYNDTKRILESAIDNLPPRQQMVYRLCHSEGMRYEEAALKLGISSLTVKTHMQQALRSIRYFLKNNTYVGIALLLLSYLFFFPL